jgi:ATP-binding cassette subfamily C protein
MPKASNHLRFALLVALLFSLALNLLILTVPLYMTAVYDRVLSSRSVETLLMLSIVAVGALALTGAIESVRQIVLTRAGARLEADLGGSVLAASLKLGSRGGEVQGLRDLAQVRQFLSSPLVGAIFDAPVAPLYVILIFMVHPHLGWLTIVCAILLVAISMLTQQLTKNPLKESMQHGVMALQTAQTQVRNAEVIRALGMFGHGINVWGEHNGKSMAAADVAARRNALLSGVTKFVRLLLQVAILGYGAYLVLSDHNLTGGIIFAASIISSRALAPLDQVIGGWRSFEQAQQSYKRVRDLLRAARQNEVQTSLPAPKATLAVERLVYTPAPGSDPIIKGISFQVEPGDVVGIIGPSGAGKSTLARLLVGAITPSAGVVRIGGDDLTHWSSEDLGPYLGYVPQDIELFPVTVAQNIARLDPSPSSEDVVAAAQLANCHGLIQRLPNGYDTVLGAGGLSLSGGQRQRVALARAFYGRPRVVVLDEPNASLDNEGESALVSALKAAGQSGMTCIVITQRTSILPAVNKLLMIKDGRIEAYGPRDEVLKNQSLNASAPGRPTSGQPVAANTAARNGAGEDTAVPARMLPVVPVNVVPPTGDKG